MGELVCAAAMTHNPRIFWNAQAAAPDDAARVYASFDAMHAMMAAARPDVVIVVANDHLDNFALEGVAPFTVGLGQHAAGPFWYEREIMALPDYGAAVAEDLALQIIAEGQANSLDLAHSRHYTLDHAFTVPLAMTVRQLPVAIVPIITNVFVPPLPDQHRFFALGQLLAHVIEQRPAGERIAVLGSMNLSVEVGGPRMGKRDDAFDRHAMDLAGRSDTAAILREMSPGRLVAAGNSTAEFLNYIAVLGAVAGRRPTQAVHHMVPQWGGCPALWWEGAG